MLFMMACVINAALIALGGTAGLLLKHRIKETYARALVTGLALCVLLIGVSSALQSADILCVITSMVIGILIGEALRIEDRLDTLGERLKARVMRDGGGGRFTEGFMTATLLFCAGSMAIMGSLQAGIEHNFDTILAKSVIDCVTSVTLAATMGVGVLFSAVAVLLYQGLITLLGMGVGPFLPETVIAEMTGVGGLLIVGLSLNMLGVLGERRVRVGNMLPAMFIPIAYIPLVGWLADLFA